MPRPRASLHSQALSLSCCSYSSHPSQPPLKSGAKFRRMFMASLTPHCLLAPQSTLCWCFSGNSSWQILFTPLIQINHLMIVDMLSAIMSPQQLVFNSAIGLFAPDQEDIKTAAAFAASQHICHSSLCRVIALCVITRYS